MRPQTPKLRYFFTESTQIGILFSLPLGTPNEGVASANLDPANACNGTANLILPRIAIFAISITPRFITFIIIRTHCLLFLSASISNVDVDLSQPWINFQPAIATNHQTAHPGTKVRTRKNPWII